MKNIFFGILVIGTCGIANLLPIPDNSTPSLQTVSSSTEKVGNEAHPTIAERKEITQTTPSTTTIPPDNSKSITRDNSSKGLGATVPTANKNEASTSQSHKEEPTVTPSSNKAEIKESTTPSLVQKSKQNGSSPPNYKQDEKKNEPPSSGYKGELKNPSATVQTGPTPIKPDNHQKPKKTSTAYLDKGKVVIFNGICGPDGCEIEGDIYDELVPLPHAKKQGL